MRSYAIAVPSLEMVRILGILCVWLHRNVELSDPESTQGQGHGRTADIDRPFSLESMADDIAALIQQLGIGSADIMGYSLGGGVALQVAVRHPEVVRKLVLVSTPIRRSDFYP